MRPPAEPSIPRAAARAVPRAAARAVPGALARAVLARLLCPLVLLVLTDAATLSASWPQVREARATRYRGARDARPILSAIDIHELRTQVGPYSIRALCTEGAREVLLLHDEGRSAESWRPVLERLDPSVGACAYDRPGSGRSEPAPGPRGWYELADEMRRIHLALGFDGGYVLVGHGVAGLYARLFTVARPTDVSGLVLVDPAHEDMPEQLRLGMPPGEWTTWMRARAEPNRDGVREADLSARMRGRRLPDIPVTVVTASLRPDGDGWDARFVDEAARRMHASILRGLTRARHVPAERSGHDVPLDEPWMLAQEILGVLGASRR